MSSMSAATGMSSTGVPAKPYDYRGNGPLMGTAPLAMPDYFDVYKIRDVPAITHARPVAE